MRMSDFFDDKAGKPVAINKYIGRRPIACFGNSDGDREMLMWTPLGTSTGRQPVRRRRLPVVVAPTAYVLRARAILR